MPPPSAPSHARAELIAQHDNLRRLMDRCEELADGIDGNPDADPTPLTRELTGLRVAFDAHNAYEEQLLRPLLLGHDSFGTVRIERMVVDHVHEHREIRGRLALPGTAEVRDVVESLRAHLDAEERYLLTSRVLRDDTSSVDRPG
jgi:hypothetical protein